MSTPSEERARIEQTMQRLRETMDDFSSLGTLKVKVRSTEPDVVERLKGVSEALKHITSSKDTDR